MDQNESDLLFVPSESDGKLLYTAPGPKIAYSYQHDPKKSPIRKISTSSSVKMIFFFVKVPFDA